MKRNKNIRVNHAQFITKAICNMGLTVNSSILSRSNFGAGRQEGRPQSVTAHYRTVRCHSLPVIKVKYEMLKCSRINELVEIKISLVNAIAIKLDL